MGFPEFYLNALSTNRREVFEFLLSLTRYVQAKDGGMNPESRYHPELSPDIRDIVLHYVNGLRENSEFMEEVNDMVNTLRREQSSSIPRFRDEVLRRANEYILRQAADPNFRNAACRVDLGFRTYLFNFITQVIGSDNLEETYVDQLKDSVSSEAVVKVRGYLERYAEKYCVTKDPKSYLNFLASVCTLLSKMADSEASNSMFEVIGEAENVLFKYKSTFPGYSSLDEFAKYEKPLIPGNNQAFHY